MQDLSARADRRGTLAAAADRSSRTELVWYRGGYRPLPVVHLPLHLPLYRADNGRLMVLEAQYLHDHDADPGFFHAGEELPEVQAALEELLIRVAQNPVAPIYQELERSRLQTENLLLTRDGVVVDGNRRLASMRRLHRQDPAGYAAFSEVEAMLLPEDATLTDLEMVEAARQMAPDTKLAYGWIDRRLKLRHHRDDLGLDTKLICESYRLKSPAQLHQEIEELELAESYLADYLGDAGDYPLVDQQEEYFTRLRSQLAQLPEGGVRDTWRLVGFAMIRAAANLNIEANRQFPFVPARPPYAPIPVLELYGGENNLWPYRAELGSGAVLRNSDYQVLVRHLQRADAANTVAGEFIRLFNQILTQHDERPHPLAIVNRLKQINQMLGRVELSAFTDSQRSELFGQLAETSYQYRYLTQSEDQDAARPIVVTGFTPLLNRGIRHLLRGLLWLRGCCSAAFRRED